MHGPVISVLDSGAELAERPATLLQHALYQVSSLRPDARSGKRVVRDDQHLELIFSLLHEPSRM